MSEERSPDPGAAKAEGMDMPPIPLNPAAPRLPAPTLPSEPRDSEAKDSTRELLETIVFVVVLVLMLKTFLAEAFVIPTGSMATTLLGYHHKVTCEQCGRPDLVNASQEAEPPHPNQRPEVMRWKCQNCQHINVFGKGLPR